MKLPPPQGRLRRLSVLLVGPARRSPNLHSAIDDDIDSGDVRTVIGGQEQSDVRHFLGPAETSEQRLAEHRARPFGVLQLFSRLIGFNQARGDGIRANTVFSPLVCRQKSIPLGKQWITRSPWD